MGQINIKNDLVKSEKFDNFISINKSYTGIVDNVKEKQNSQEIILKIKSETDEVFNIKVITNNIPIYIPGETLKIEGKISTSSILMPSLERKTKSIDLGNNNKLNHIDGEMFFPKINMLDNLKGESFLSYFYKVQNLKRHFTTHLEKFSSVNGAALGAGTLIGDASLFSVDDMNNFRLSGLSHIVVVSGFNVTIIIFVLIYLFSFFNLRLKIRIFLLIFCIVLFMGFIGFGSSILRAGFMSIVLLLAYGLGRKYLAKQSLFLVSLVMIILNPKISAFDTSFHLSFLATFSILFIFPIFKYLFNLNFEKIKSNFLRKFLQSIYEIFLITLSIQVVTLPYVCFIFGYISPLGIFANIFVLPFLPLVMLLGFLIFFFYFSNIISFALGALLSFFSSYIFFIAKFFSSFNVSKIEIDFSFLFLIVYYFCIILFLLFEIKRIKIKKYLEKENL